MSAEPGDRAPAPGQLRLVQRFVNTNDLEGGPELIPDAAALREWLATAGLLEPSAGGVDGALGRIVAAIHAGVADGTWERLKACERDVCRWAFYDHSKNRSGHWCSMAVCGQREKNRRAYRRRVARARS